MIDYLILPEKIMSHEVVEVPAEPEPICLNLVIIKGIHTLPHNAMTDADTLPVFETDCLIPGNHPMLGMAKIYEVKHMVLADTLRYPALLSYFHDRRYSKFVALRQYLRELYAGLINGEIVTLVFFTPGEGLLDGTRATPEASQDTEQTTI